MYNPTIEQNLTILRAAPHVPFVAKLAVHFATIVTKTKTARENARSIRHLDQHLLRDAGLLDADLLHPGHLERNLKFDPMTGRIL